jgi:hypothetical protein
VVFIRTLLKCNGLLKICIFGNSNRRRKRSQRYTQNFVEAVSDIDLNFDSDDDIMGEAVYDEEYLRSRKQHKGSSASEDDEEFRLEEDAEDDEEEEEYSQSTSEDIEEPHRLKKLKPRGRRGTKLRSVDEIQTGLRRSKRSSCPRINYQLYDFSDTDTEPGKTRKSDSSDPDACSDAESGMDLSISSQEEQEEEEGNSPDERNGNNVNNKMEDNTVAENKQQGEEQQPPQQHPVDKMDPPSTASENVGRTFLDLNELAPGGGFDDVPGLTMKDNMDNS